MDPERALVLTSTDANSVVATIQYDALGRRTWHQFDPYGNPRGTTATWIDNRTFLDKVTDPSTRLTDVGARWYDGTLGRFISLDPVFESGDTLALGGYGYTDGNPISQEDPSGQMIADPNGGGGSEQALEAEEEAASARDDLTQIANDASTMQNDANQIDTDLDTSEMLSQYLGDGQGKAQEYLDDGLKLQQQYLAAANNARDNFIDYVNTLRDVGKWEMEYGGELDEGISEVISPTQSGRIGHHWTSWTAPT